MIILALPVCLLSYMQRSHCSSKPTTTREEISPSSIYDAYESF
jgi:hypothetical protein